jgi:hypothetical protein
MFGLLFKKKMKNGRQENTQGHRLALPWFCAEKQKKQKTGPQYSTKKVFENSVSVTVS